jgi:hypothetical protein
MIITGIRKATLLRHPSDHPCPHCNKTGTVQLKIFSRHFHFFWIPCFPLGKTGEAVCSHCKFLMTVKEFPMHIRREYDEKKSRVSPKIWQFSGIILLFVLIPTAVYIAERDTQLEVEYITRPAIGDIYSYETPSSEYSTMKVIDVDADSVYVIENDYTSSKMSKVYKIDKPENYSGEPFGISRMDLKQRYDDREIYDVQRE